MGNGTDTCRYCAAAYPYIEGAVSLGDWRDIVHLRCKFCGAEYTVQRTAV